MSLERMQHRSGLGHEDTDGAEVIPYVWRRMVTELLDKVEILSEDTADNPTAVPLVAHNAGFDSRCLREVFRCYRMDYPEFVFHDTLAASKKHFQGNLTNHHHALADAEACAWIAREIL